MNKRFFSALCAASLTVSLMAPAFAADYAVSLTEEEALGDAAVLLDVPAVTPASPGTEPDRITVTAPLSGAAVEICINGKAADADILFLDENGQYTAADDMVCGDDTVSTILTESSATLVILQKPPFTDVSRSAWYYSGVAYAYHHQLMSGVSSTKFSPNGTADRAQLVTILYRVTGEPAVSDSESFRDVSAGKYYTDAVAWAAAAGVVTGSGNGNFNPTGTLTREQLAVILYRFAQYEGRDTTARADLSGYTDSAKVSSWASDAMAWAVAEGLITGSNSKALSPASSASRAQLATILMRFCGDQL